MNLSVALSVDATEKHRFKYASSAAVEAEGGTETEGPTENEILAYNWTQCSERQLASVLALPLSDNRSVLDFKQPPCTLCGSFNYNLVAANCISGVHCKLNHQTQDQVQIMPPKMTAAAIRTATSLQGAADSKSKKRGKSAAGLDNDGNPKPVKGRSAIACAACRVRKVRCNIMQSYHITAGGRTICSNCTLDGTNCVVEYSKRLK